MKDPTTGLECLDDFGDGECEGAVELRYPLSATGIPYPRCEYHWAARVKQQQLIDERYGSVSPPSDFDPTYAGERWDEDY